MGHSTESMFYMAVILIVIYIVGMLIFDGCRLFKKWWNERKDRRFRKEE